MKEHKDEHASSPVIGTNGGGVSDKYAGSPTTSIAIEGERAQPATFGYNTKPEHHAHERERFNKGGY